MTVPIQNIPTIINTGLLQAQLNAIFDELFAGAVTLVPLTNGAEPPAFITDGAGRLIFTSFDP